MPKNEPVSVVLSRTVKPGKESEYENLAHEAISASRRYTGHAGTTVIKEGQRRYHLVYRFSNHDKLDEWLASPERKHIRQQINKITEDNSDIKKLTGFETWFRVPGESPLKSPPRIKMWLATVLASYPLVVIFQAVLAPRVSAAFGSISVRQGQFFRCAKCQFVRSLSVEFLGNLCKLCHATFIFMRLNSTLTNRIYSQSKSKNYEKFHSFLILYINIIINAKRHGTTPRKRSGRYSARKRCDF
jgi:antibiotic biosynthesis monooxygenase (ABM) superfamily enzyme